MAVTLLNTIMNLLVPQRRKQFWLEELSLGNRTVSSCRELFVFSTIILRSWQLMAHPLLSAGTMLKLYFQSVFCKCLNFARPSVAVRANLQPPRTECNRILFFPLFRRIRSPFVLLFICTVCFDTRFISYNFLAVFLFPFIISRGFFLFCVLSKRLDLFCLSFPRVDFLPHSFPLRVLLLCHKHRLCCVPLSFDSLISVENSSHCF
jgi:hypothetical protein